MAKMKSLCIAGILSAMALTSCTDLTENIYSELTKDNYYRDKQSVESAVLRAHEHGDNVTWRGDIMLLEELTGDHFVWTQKGRHGYDDGQWIRLHEHKWNYIQGQINGAWVAAYQGISQANVVLRHFNTLDFASIGVNDEEKAAYFAELRVLRAWYYTFLLNHFRSIPIATEANGEDEIVEQSTPQEVFAFLEKELKEAIPSLPKEKRLSRWTQGPAAGLLVRLYLNAETWIGEKKYAECKQVAQDIIDGKYGHYELEKDYRDPFRSGIDGYNSPENLFEFKHEYGQLQQYTWWDHSSHYAASRYIGSDGGGWNAIHLQPSRDFQGNVYHFESGLGNPFESFDPCDYRRTPFHVIDKANTGKGVYRYEGFFIQGQMFVVDRRSGEKYATFEEDPLLGQEEWMGYPLVFVDQVGRFSEQADMKQQSGESDEAFKARKTQYMLDVAKRGYYVCNDPAVIAKGSQVITGEENSGFRFNKFPYLPIATGQFRSQCTPEIRLAEIYYSLAECYYREGNKSKAAELLDAVRVRNYPPEEWGNYSYSNHLDRLTDTEFLKDWGREFMGERRRRTDLVRWGKFGEAWWNKEKDPQDGVERNYFPIPQKQLNASPILKQTTPGWE